MQSFSCIGRTLASTQRGRVSVSVRRNDLLFKISSILENLKHMGSKEKRIRNPSVSMTSSKILFHLYSLPHPPPQIILKKTSDILSFQPQHFSRNLQNTGTFFFFQHHCDIIITPNMSLSHSDRWLHTADLKLAMGGVGTPGTSTNTQIWVRLLNIYHLTSALCLDG